MRHPDKFSHALGVSYGITFAVDLSMGVIGYLMFGKYVLEEVTTLNYSCNGRSLKTFWIVQATPSSSITLLYR